jgi:hypothetical protein
MKPAEFNYKGHRKGYTDLNEVYFWTITINQWQHLLKPDDNKMLVINSLQWLKFVDGQSVGPANLNEVYSEIKYLKTKKI